MDANDTGHIWLRQTVTFTVDGQTRTLEIGIPVPSDATAQDVEALLEVSDAGMDALSRHLDTRIAELLDGGPHDNTPALLAPAQEAAFANGHEPAGPLATEPAPAPEEPVERSRNASATRAPTPSAPEHQTRPAQPQPVAAPERPIPAQPQQRSEPPRAKPPVAAPATSAEMTRPEFLSAAAELGLNPRQAMDRLGVRSLEGLNLREALESLRRQLLGASSHAEPESGPEQDFAPEPVTGASPTVTAPPVASRFEEEDDETIFYALEEDDELIEDNFAPALAGNGANPVASDDALNETGDDDSGDGDEIDLDEVPDLSPPPVPPRARATAPGRKTTSAARETSAPAQGAASVGKSTGARTQALRQIGKLRSATGGGTASEYQRNAYRNIVENELGRTRAVALVRGLWRTTADHLTAGQLDALIRWGKEEVFAEEAEHVLAALRAEQERADQEAAAANGSDAPAAPRPAPRGRSAGGAR
ncbi:MAG TPA: hypothetical protein VFS83_05175 [Ktedonobacterales bacterium]|nr:hypothetical protein [Ktedonobacterales bacterium]